MIDLRTSALQTVSKRRVRRTILEKKTISEYFGSDTLTVLQMKALLPLETYEKVTQIGKDKAPLDKQTANAVADLVRDWAISKGATHYSHWFHPLTGSTAEKHDCFFDHRSKIETLTSRALIQQEPDASSFPSGGIRSTFEARGYTAWACSSPFFIWHTTLCVPTIFVAYTGEALDEKTPLLRSIQSVSHQAANLCRYFDEKVARVHPMVGWEQEYFLVDRALYQARPDLLICGRTLFGHPPAKGQQLEDHYFGSIAPRVMEYMKAFEQAAYRLGIPLQTRHNEVAPAQYEVASMFEEAQIAADHNQLLRDVMEKIALEHDLQVLFQEKPFAGLNGSGKHCNWSLMTNTGINLLQPNENVLFLIFLLLVLRGVYRHSDILRASIASYGNDLRLGAQEAPPTIISVFIGEPLERVITTVAEMGNLEHKHLEKSLFSLGIDQIPSLSKDTTDRNRTSPFAFTGNKFEFRAVGAEGNISAPITALNTLIAKECRLFSKQLVKMPTEKEAQHIFLAKLLSQYAKEVQPIIFNGDGYLPEWQKEAKKRRLPDAKTTPEALEIYTQKSTALFFGEAHILSEKELISRYEIELSKYIKKVNIEAQLVCNLVGNHIIPATVDYQNKLLDNVIKLKQVGIEKAAIKGIIQEINSLIDLLLSQIEELKVIIQQIHTLSDPLSRAKALSEKVCDQHFVDVRKIVDKLELLVDNQAWPLVKYRELLFLR